MPEKGKCMLQTWIDEDHSLKIDHIAVAARVKRPDIIRVMVADFIERFEERNGSIDLNVEVTLPGQD